MALYDRYGADVNNVAVACTESVTINATTYYRGRVAQVAGLSVLGSTSPSYGVWTATSKGGTRLTVVASPGLPADTSEVAWDCVSGYVYSTTSRTVHAYYRGHGTFSPTTDDVAAAVAAAVAAGVANLVTGPASATNDTLVAFDGTTGKLVKGSGVGLGTAPAGALLLLCGGMDIDPADGGGIYLDGVLSLDQAVAAASSPTFAGLLLGAGAVGTPALRGSSDTNTGLYFPAADQVALACNGVQRLLANTSGVAVTGTLSSTGKITVGSTDFNGSSMIRNTGSGRTFVSVPAANVVEFGNSSTPASTLYRFGRLTSDSGTPRVVVYDHTNANVETMSVDCKTGAVRLNEQGHADGDLNWESDTNASAFVLDAGANSGAGSLTCSMAQINFTALPTSDPAVAGRLWRDGTTVKVSV